MPSAAVERAHWHQGVLSLKYRNGDTYDYFDVPEEVWLQYRHAASKGRFINWVIKPNYRYQKRVHH